MSRSTKRFRDAHGPGAGIVPLGVPVEPGEAGTSVPLPAWRPRRGMTDIGMLELSPAPHPDPQVRRAGFPLTDPYVEQCWSAVAGPSTVLLLRRLPDLWAEQAPARVHADDLGRMLGLGNGTTHNSRLARTLDRAVRFNLATWDDPGTALRVYTEAAPLSRAQLERVPDWTRRTHDRLLDGHLNQLALSASPPSRATELVERLDRLQHRVQSVDAPVPVLGR
mgnify:CR=1 FL=1